MKNAVVACVVACAAMVWTGVRAEENPLLADGVLEVNVPSGEQEGFTTDQLAALKDPACVELKKTGAGMLTLKSSAGGKTFAGKITIAEGTYMVGYQPSSGNDSPLGTGDGQTEVMSGATLGFRCYMAADVLKSERIIVGGKGFNDGGALLLLYYTPENIIEEHWDEQGVDVMRFHATNVLQANDRRPEQTLEQDIILMSNPEAGWVVRLAGEAGMDTLIKVAKNLEIRETGNVLTYDDFIDHYTFMDGGVG